MNSDAPAQLLPPATAMITEHRPLYRSCAAVMLLVLVGLYFQFRVRENRFDQGHNIAAIPDRGFDLEAYHLFASQWWKGESPYSLVARAGPNPYPPFFTLFFSPFALLPFHTAYLAFVILSMAALLLAVYLSTHAGGPDPPDWLTFATWAAVLTQTYPVLFVIERGTPELIILGLMTGGLHLLRGKRWGWGVVLLTLATHMKLYPLILGCFVLLRTGVRGALWFAAMVLGLFLILGVDALADFVDSLGGTIVKPGPWIWPGNHSIRSFAQWAAIEGWFPLQHIGTFSAVLTLALLAVFGGCLLATWLASRGKGPAGPFSVRETALLGMAFALMSLVPTFSHDYKLSIQFVPFLLLICGAEADDAARRSPAVRNVCVILAIAVAFLFAPLVRVPRTLFLLPCFFAYVALWFVAKPRRAGTGVGAATAAATPPASSALPSEPPVLTINP